MFPAKDRVAPSLVSYSKEKKRMKTRAGSVCPTANMKGEEEEEQNNQNVIARSGYNHLPSRKDRKGSKMNKEKPSVQRKMEQKKKSNLTQQNPKPALHCFQNPAQSEEKRRRKTGKK